MTKPAKTPSGSSESKRTGDKQASTPSSKSPPDTKTGGGSSGKERVTSIGLVVSPMPIEDESLPLSIGPEAHLSFGPKNIYRKPPISPMRSEATGSLPTPSDTSGGQRSGTRERPTRQQLRDLSADLLRTCQSGRSSASRGSTTEPETPAT